METVKQARLALSSPYCPTPPEGLRWWLDHMPPEAHWLRLCPRPDWLLYLLRASGRGSAPIAFAEHKAAKALDGPRRKRASWDLPCPLTDAADAIRSFVGGWN